MRGFVIAVIAFVLLISPIAQGEDSDANKIPAWVKNSAGWWADGVITEDDFIKGIEYMVNSGIIQVDQTFQSQTVPTSLGTDTTSSEDAVDTTPQQSSLMCLGNARCFTGP